MSEQSYRPVPTTAPPQGAGGEQEAAVELQPQGNAAMQEQLLSEQQQRSAIAYDQGRWTPGVLSEAALAMGLEPGAPVDAEFVEAAAAFQAEEGLGLDGMIGPLTMGRLLSQGLALPGGQAPALSPAQVRQADAYNQSHLEAPVVAPVEAFVGVSPTGLGGDMLALGGAAYQSAMRIGVDGKIGPQTFSHMIGAGLQLQLNPLFISSIYGTDAIQRAVKKNHSTFYGDAKNANAGLIYSVRHHLGLPVVDAHAKGAKTPDPARINTEELAVALSQYQLSRGLSPADGTATKETLAAMEAEGMAARKPGDWKARDDAEQAEVLGQEQAAAAAGDAARQAKDQEGMRAAVVSLAASQIGKVSSSNRGDGNKYGWKRIERYYTGLGLGVDGGVRKAGYFKGDSQANQKEHTGDWSWCGIFAMWAVKSTTGQGGWSQKPTGLNDQKPDTVAQARPGDVVAIQGPTNHHVLVESVDPSAGTLQVIEGNVIFQGIQRQEYAFSEISAWYSLAPLLPEKAPPQSQP